MVKKINIEMSKPHGFNWVWHYGAGPVLECECGDLSPCDKTVMAKGWVEHLRAIAEFIYEGGAKDLEGKDLDFVIDALYDLVELDI